MKAQAVRDVIAGFTLVWTLAGCATQPCPIGTWELVDVADYAQSIGYSMKDVVTTGSLRYSFRPDKTVEVAAESWGMQFTNLCCAYGMDPDTAPHASVTVDGAVTLRYEYDGSAMKVAWLEGGLHFKDGSGDAVDYHVLPPMAFHEGRPDETYVVRCEEDRLLITQSGSAAPAPQPAQLRRVR
jgi:hypothetical protein